MSISNAEIITNGNQADILNRLKKITIEEQPFIKPRGIFFLGKINENKFKLITFNSPPIEVEFTISVDKIKIKSDQHSLMPDITAITYVLGFCLAFTLFLWGMIDKHFPPMGRPFLPALIVLPYVFNKIGKSRSKRFTLPTNHELFNRIEELLEVKIAVIPDE